MIHWDWIVTGVIGLSVWKFVDRMFTLFAHVTYPYNRAIISNVTTQYIPQVKPLVDDILGDNNDAT